MSDQSAVIEAVIAGWSSAIAQAARKYRLAGDDLDELLQDVRLRLWRALERRGGEPGALAPGFGYQAAVSAAIDLLRARRSRQRVLVSLEELTAAGAPAARAGGTEAGVDAALDRALLRLSEDRRVAVRLHLNAQGLEDIIVVTGWSRARARNLLYRGLEDLRRELEVEAPG